MTAQQLLSITSEIVYLGLFALATYNLQLALGAVEERVEVAVYLRDDARQSEIDLLVADRSEMIDGEFVREGVHRDACPAVTVEAVDVRPVLV